MTVYVKIAPGGYIRRLVCDPEDSIWHLHNMLRSHSDVGSVRGAQFVLPTSVAFFECEADIIPESEYLGAINTANIKLKDYGLRSADSSITILYLPRYKDTTIIPLMRNFMKENMDITGLNLNLPIVKYIDDIPQTLEKDDIQVKLSIIMKRQYHDQEMEDLKKMKLLGSERRKKAQEDYAEFVKKKQKEKLEASRVRVELEKQIDKKLKGLEGFERDEKRRQLMEEIFDSKEKIDESHKMAAKVKKDIERTEKLKKKRELIASGALTAGDSLNKFYNTDSLDSKSEPTSISLEKVEEDSKNKMVSFADETNQSTNSLEEGKPNQKIKVPPLYLQSKDDDFSLLSGSAFEDNSLPILSTTLPNLKRI
jgi:hypothetical protein